MDFSTSLSETGKNVLLFGIFVYAQHFSEKSNFQTENICSARVNRKKFKSSSIYHVIAHSNVCPMKTIFQKLQVDKSLIMVCLQN